MKDYEKIAIDKLKPYKNNARMHSEEQIEMIMNSLREFGFVAPCIIDEKDMILVGHGRIEAAKLLGIKEVPYRRITHLTEDQKKAYILADNKLSDMGGWDLELLESELENIDIDMSEFGFDFGEYELPDLEDLDEDGGVIEDNTQNPVAVKLVFDNAQKWRNKEQKVREFVDSLENVKVSVGLYDES